MIALSLDSSAQAKQANAAPETIAPRPALASAGECTARRKKKSAASTSARPAIPVTASVCTGWTANAIAAMPAASRIRQARAPDAKSSTDTAAWIATLTACTRRSTARGSRSSRRSWRGPAAGTALGCPRCPSTDEANSSGMFAERPDAQVVADDSGVVEDEIVTERVQVDEHGGQSDGQGPVDLGTPPGRGLPPARRCVWTGTRRPSGPIASSLWPFDPWREYQTAFSDLRVREPASAWATSASVSR